MFVSVQRKDWTQDWCCASTMTLRRTTTAMLTNIVSAVANVGRYLVYTLAVQNCQVLSEGTGQLLINGPDKTKVFISGFKKKSERKTNKQKNLPLLKEELKNKKQRAVMLKLTCTCWKPPWLVSTPAAQTPPFQSGMQCRPEITPQPMMRSSSVPSLTTLHQQ